MLESALALFALLLFLAIVAGVLVLPIIALARTARIRGLEDRLAALEREVSRLRTPAQQGVVATVLPEPAPTAAPADAATPGRPEEAPPEVLPVRRRRPPPPPQTAIHWEEWLGARGLGWAAVVLLLFAVGFFIKVAFDNQWIGELGRVTLGVLLGAGLCALGVRYHRRGWRLFSQMLTAAGVAVLYLAIFATFGFYHLLPREHAAIFLIALVVEAAALAILYEAPAIALMAVIGGLVAPILLHTDRDQYVNLFVYLTALNAGAAGLTLLRRWPGLATVALLGTQILFWGWYGEHFHPAKRSAALAFQAGIFLLYLGQAVLASLLRRPTAWATLLAPWTDRPIEAPATNVAGVEDLVRLVVNSFLFALAGYVLLDPDYHAWMGTMALGLAILHTLLAWLVFARRPEEEWLVLVLVATAMAFVAAVFPLQANAAWIAVGWAVQGLVLWWFSLRVRAEGVRTLGAALLLLAACRLLLVDTPRAHPGPFVPILNSYGLPALVVAGCVVAAGIIGRRYLTRLGPAGQVVVRGTGLAGVALVWIVLSFESYDYFMVRAERLPLGPAGWEGEILDKEGRPWQAVRADERQHLEQSAQVALSVVWAAFAAVVLAVGFRLPSQPLRWGALGLFGLTLLKVVFVDMAYLPGLYRVAAFLMLALMMGAGAWGYQKMKALFLVNEHEGAS